MRDVVLIRMSPGAPLDLAVQRAVALVVQEGAARVDVWRHEGGGLALVQGDRVDAGDAFAIHQTPDEALSYAGFVADPDGAPADVRRLVSFDRDPVMTRSPGGIATYFLADARSRRLLAWSSHAGLEGPYCTVGAACTAISNRPLLSHLVARASDRPSFSLAWARRALLGPTLWEDTPFEGTRQAPPRSALAAGDQLRVVPHPIALGARFARRDPAGVDALCQAALAAVAPLARWPRGELWLSGGKDSRMALALVRRAGIDIDVVTHARTGAGEGEAASAVARALGVPHRIVEGGAIATGDDLLPAVLDNLRRAGGLVGEPRTLAYRSAPHPAGPVVHGQAHHPRGGFRVRLGPVREEIERQLADQFLADRDLVAAPIGDEREARLGEILAGYRESRELAYWLYADWRMSRLQSAAYAAAARTRAVVWPMVDERVLEVTAGLAPDDRASETAFFAALLRLAPELACVPLHENQWRFDSGKRAGAAFPDGFEARRMAFRERGRGRTADRRISTIQPLFRQAMAETPAGRELAQLVRPEILRALYEEPEPALALGRPHMQIINFMWRASAVALVMEGAWTAART